MSLQPRKMRAKEAGYPEHDALEEARIQGFNEALWVIRDLISYRDKQAKRYAPHNKKDEQSRKDREAERGCIYSAMKYIERGQK